MASKQEMVQMALAVKQGLIKKEQVQECMDLQAALMEQKGVELPLLQIALKKKYLTPDQVGNLSGGAGAPEIPGVGDHVSVEEANRIPIFEVAKEIGQGGMATVFLAKNKKTGRKCALKVLFPKHTSNAKFVERFIREGKLLREFDSENIAKGFEYGVVGKDSPKPLYFMSMEYIKGPSIQDMLDKEGVFDEQKCIYVITEAAKGLAYMQERGIVHRDIKPDNIMWSQDGRVMLVDLGFATPIKSDAAGEYEDETCGTVQYISPEQAKGQADLDIRADIYSLGATFYHMLIGELPFSGKDSMDIMAKQVMEQLNSGKFKKVSVHMHYFIEKMMSKDRDFRYQTAREIVEDIDEVLEGAADLQYNPAEDIGNSSIFGFDPHASQRMTAHSTGNFTPVPRTSPGRLAPTGQSVRMKPSGQSVRMPGSNSTSIRTPLKANTKSTGSLRKPGVSGTNPGVKKPGSSVRVPPKNVTNPGTSVRMPTSRSGKAVKLPGPRKK
ncbi:MAG: serine/threonine protein kinase [Planctomycetota bacterium]|jgi:serine/threonine-protein kinase